MDIPETRLSGRGPSGRTGRMLPKMFLLALMACVPGSIIGSAMAGESFTPAQKAEIVTIMRQALKDNPDILAEAVQSLREKAMLEQQGRNKEGIARNWSALTSAPSYTIRGNPQGSLTVVEFLDPRCGYCRRMMPVVDDFLKRHRDVRLIEKIVPVLGKPSLIASKAVFAAALQGHYDAMRQAMMSESAAPDTESLRSLAKEQGLDVNKFVVDMDGPAVMAMIAANMEQARAIGLDGTPTFLFGQAVEAPGAMEPEQMDQLLDQAKAAQKQQMKK